MYRFFIIFQIALMLLVTGCQQHLVTGQIDMVAAVNGTGELSSTADIIDGEFISQGQPFSIRLSSVFPHIVREAGSAEFLVFAEIYDRIDEQDRLVKVLFEDSDQSPGMRLNQRDRGVFGPIIYNGEPIRIRFFFVELDQEDNQVAGSVIKKAVGVASTAAPQFAPFAPVAASVGDLVIALNQDDREVVYDFTLFPNTHSQGPYLKSGHIVLIKTENSKRRVFSAEKEAPLVYEDGTQVNKNFEDYGATFIYGENDQPRKLRPIKCGPLTIYRRMGIKVANSGLVLDTAALELYSSSGNEIVMATNEYIAGLESDKHSVWDLKTPKKLTITQKQVQADGTVASTNYLFSERVYKYANALRRELLVEEVDDSGKVLKTFNTIPFDIMEQYREKTYAVITIAKGGKPHPRSVFESMSLKDSKILEDVLQPELNAERLEEKLAALSQSILRISAAHEVAGEVATELPASASERVTSDTPMAYLKRLDPAPNSDEAIAKNQAIIYALRGMIRGFPYEVGDADDATKIREMLSIDKSQLSSNNDGTFTLKVPVQQLVFQWSSPTISVRKANATDSAAPTATLKVYHKSEYGAVNEVTSKVFYQIVGSPTPASDTTPSSHEGGEIDKDGKYTPPAKVKEQSIRVLLKKDLKTTGLVKVPLVSNMRIKSIEASIPASGTTAEQKIDIKPSGVNEAAWMKRGVEISLKAIFEATDDNATIDHSQVDWTIEQSEIATVTDGKLKAEDGQTELTLTVTATSKIDKNVTQSFEIKLAPTPQPPATPATPVSTDL